MLSDGKKRSDTRFAVYTLTSPANKRRLFIGTVAKKIIPLSTSRNLLKRRMRAVFAEDPNMGAGLDILIISRFGAAQLKEFAQVRDALKGLLSKKPGEK